MTTSNREQGPRRRTVAIIAVVSLLAVAAVAWLAEGLLTTPDDIPPLLVTRGGEVLATFSMAEIRDLPTHEVSQFGKWEEGPQLLLVLSEAGVEDFERVTILGQGVRDDGEIVLTRAEIDEDVVLDLANRGTVKIAGPDISWADRVRDLTEIRVE
ncbi:MAG: hypothetical protein XD74_1381 [Actinobacteria bacterium 66_15]|nr:MAG: hypothetical protein XD74_1381 [Actinobacteria bacterium 66_15]